MWGLGVLAVTAVYIIGGYWCYIVLGRFRADVRELRETSEPAAKISIVVIWVITALIALVLLGIGLVLGVVLVYELRQWL